MSRTRRMTAATTVLAACALTLGACSMDATGGDTWSKDSYTYRSTPFAPKTIELVDVRTEEVIWALDIPAGWELEMSFGEDNINSDGVAASNMNWKLKPYQVRGKSQSGKFIAPPRGSRRVDMVLRESPEHPSAETGDPTVAEATEDE